MHESVYTSQYTQTPLESGICVKRTQIINMRISVWPISVLADDVLMMAV